MPIARKNPEHVENIKHLGVGHISFISLVSKKDEQLNEHNKT